MKQTNTTQRQTYMMVGLVVSLIILSAATVTAQNTAESRAAGLRAQLVHVQEQQAELQTRLRQLEEDLKTENIEKSLAGVGSTHPEDLREQRRRQLEIERKGLQAQLDLLATSRTRLETGVAQADADAYRQSAGSNTSGSQPKITRGGAPQSSGVQTGAANSTTLRHRTRRLNRKRSKPRRVSQGNRLSTDCADYTD